MSVIFFRKWTHVCTFSNCARVDYIMSYVIAGLTFRCRSIVVESSVIWKKMDWNSKNISIFWMIILMRVVPLTVRFWLVFVLAINFGENWTFFFIWFKLGVNVCLKSFFWSLLTNLLWFCFEFVVKFTFL